MKKKVGLKEFLRCHFAILCNANLFYIGLVDGQEWIWQDLHAVNHIFKLHCKRHQAAGSNK
jgi:hypothetical protein